MEVTVEPQPKSVVKLTVKLTPQEMEEYLEKAAQAVAGQVNVPGFRKGKAPRKVVAQQVGPDYLEHQAVDRAVTESYYDAILKNDLKPLGRPEADVPHTHGHLEKDGLTYTATVPVLPPVDLGDYQSVRVKPKKPEYKDEMLRDTLEQLRKSRAEQKEVDRPAQKGDRVEIDFVGILNGTEFPGGKSENHPLVLGEDGFIPGFADNLLKMAKGQVKKFKIKFPKDYHEASLAGQKAEFTVTMKKVEENVLPELDDAFAKQFGAKSLAELQERLTQNLREEKEQEARRATEGEVIDKVLDKTKVEIPDVVVEDELNTMMGEFRQALERQGLPYDKYLEHLGKSEEDIRQEARPEAEKRAKLSLVLNAIQEAEGIKPADKEVSAEIAKQRELAPDAETRERIESDEFRTYVQRIVGNRAVVAKMVERATA